MTRLITPNGLGSELKPVYIEAACEAAELARQLHNKLRGMQAVGFDDAIEEDDAGRKALQERLDAVEALEGELLEHAMRVTLGV